MNNLKIIFALALIGFACASKSDDQKALQIAFLDSLINTEYQSLHERVYTTGYTEHGRNYLEKSKDNFKLYEQILISQSIDEIKELTAQLIANSNIDGVTTQSVEFLSESLEDKNLTNSDSFVLSLRLYMLRILQNYHQEVNSLFYMFDMVQPIVFTKSNIITNGDDFVADISLEAGMSAIHPEVSVKFKDQEFALIEVIGGRGKLVIRKPTPGTHNLRLKVDYYSNMEKRSSEYDYEFEVTD